MNSWDHQLSHVPIAIHSLAAHAKYTMHVLGSGSAVGTFRILAYRVNRAPEHAPAELAFAEIVEAENLDNPADVDEFLLTVAPGDSVATYLQSVDALPPGMLALGITDDARTQTYGSTITNIGAADDFESSGTGPVLLSQGGRYRANDRVLRRRQPMRLLELTY